MYPLILETTLQNLKVFKRNPFWDIYGLNGRLLFVALDRVSAHGQAIPAGIPYKGIALAKIIQELHFLFKKSFTTHYLTSEIKKMPTDMQRASDILEERSFLVKRTSVIPLECEVRRYLVGETYQRFAKVASICGLDDPPDPEEGERLDEPVFLVKGKESCNTSTYLSPGQVAEIIGDKIADELKERTLVAFDMMEKFLEERGFILCETCFNWGLHNGEIILIDEPISDEGTILWDRADYEKGTIPHSYEREPLYEYLENQANGEIPSSLPKELVQALSQRYRDFCYRITGHRIEER